MHTKLEDWKNGWLDIELGIAAEEIDVLIDRLEMLKKDHDQHFHLSSDYKGNGGIGDITIYVQSPNRVSNMERISSGAIAPGQRIDPPRS